jgi:hypothetical protein
MSVEESLPASADALELEVRVDTAAIETDAKNAMFGDRRGVPELYIKSPRLARIGAALLAAFVAIGTTWWAWVARALFRQELVCEGCAPDWYPLAQLVLAFAGIAAALVTMAYLTRFAASGRIWRRWTGVSATFGVLAASWTALYWVVRIVGWS